MPPALQAESMFRSQDLTRELAQLTTHQGTKMPTAEAAYPEVSPKLETTHVEFKRILVAIDFSKQTSQVLDTAIRIATVFNSQLFLVNAATPAVYGTGAEPVPIETFDVNLEIAQACMTALVDGQPALTNLAHKEFVAYARPLDLIRKVIEEENVDLVVAGAHGANGIERLALGSVIDSIVRNVSCPVLVIGPRTAPQADLFGSILLAASLTPADQRCAQYAMSLAQHFHSKLNLLHVVEAKSPRIVQPELLEAHLIAKLEALVPADPVAHDRAAPRIEYGRAGDLIASIASGRRSSLIVTGAHAENTFSDGTPWSTLAEVVRRARCPVLCVRGHLA